MFAVRVSSGGPTAALDALPASDNAPAIPNTVTAFVRPFCFDFCLPRDMVEASNSPHPTCNYKTFTSRRQCAPGERKKTSKEETRNCCAVQQPRAPHVRFGSKADIEWPAGDVRFTPKSGHWRAPYLGLRLAGFGRSRAHALAGALGFVGCPPRSS